MKKYLMLFCLLVAVNSYSKTIVDGQPGDVSKLIAGANIVLDPATGEGDVTIISLGGGDVSKVGTPVDNQVGVWTGDGTIEGTAGLTYNGSTLGVTGDLTTSGDLTVSNVLYTVGGGVGIGTAAPAEKLEVVGNVNISGNYMTNGVPLNLSGAVTSVNEGTNIVITGTAADPIINDGGAYIGADAIVTAAYIAADTVVSNVLQAQVSANTSTGNLNTAAAAAAQTTADGALSRADGGIMSNAVYTTRDFDTLAPTSEEMPSAGWVRSLSQSGQQWFFTTNVNAAAWAKTANFVDLELDVVDQFTNSIASPVASDTYLAGGITTQLFGELRSPIRFQIYINRVGGNVTTEIPVHPEVYYIYNGQTNQLGDWEVSPQVIESTVPMLYTFTIPFSEPALTGSVQIVSYLKSDTVSGTAAGLNIYGGGVLPSHMDISAVPAGESFADALHVVGDNKMLGNFNLGTKVMTNGSALLSALSVYGDTDIDGDLTVGGALDGDGSGLTNLTANATPYWVGVDVITYTGAAITLLPLKQQAELTLTNAVTISASASMVRAPHMVTIYGTNVVTMASSFRQTGTWTQTGTNHMSMFPEGQTTNWYYGVTTE